MRDYTGCFNRYQRVAELKRIDDMSIETFYKCTDCKMFFHTKEEAKDHQFECAQKADNKRCGTCKHFVDDGSYGHRIGQCTEGIVCELVLKNPGDFCTEWKLKDV